jgi:glycosyltransferase XagB
MDNEQEKIEALPAVNNVTVEEEILLMSSQIPLVSIILPTFNESKNISELLRLIEEVMQSANYSYECVFVDDSRDDTPEVIYEEAYKYPNIITLIKRSGTAAKTGLTMAFRRGFAAAKGEIIVCMDTDLQHPPAQIAKLVKAVLTQKIDVAVASRYCYGGSSEGLGNIFNYFVWLLLPSTRKTTDPMTGFFAFRKETLKRVHFSSLGFKVLVELLAGLDNPKVMDIPFTFLKRKHEESKAKLIQGFIFYRDILSLFITGPRGSEGVKFVFLASVSSFVYLGILSLTSFLSSFINLDSFIWHKENLLIVCVAVSVIPIFGWAFISGNYALVRFQNILLALAFIGLVSVGYLHIFNSQNHLQNNFFFAPAALLISYVAVYLLFKPLWRKDYKRAVSLERWFAIVFSVFLFTIFSYFLDFAVWWYSLLLAMYVVVIAQGLFALYLMVYTWENNSTKLSKPENEFALPRYSFTAIVPCKHEKNTIADTLKAMNAINYPADKKQIIVVIHEGTDDGTIGVVLNTIESLNAPNIQLVTYNEAPINKPHGLNKALEQSTGDYVAIFDAEDEPHVDLFNVINTSLISTNADVVQSGVQLMNFHSNWYSTFNVLEYYFWFKSSLHFYAKNNVMPLGGVSVFFRKTMLEQVGGWDLSCLTEDAEIGIRLSQAGAKMSVIYEAKYATREETPPTVISFVKQRTRWAQGFLQILSRRAFMYFPTFKQRFLAAYILSWPLIIPFVFLLFPFGIVLMLSVSVPPALAVLSNISLFLFVAFTVTLIIGFYEFVREYQLKFSYSRILVLIFLFYPYTLLLTIASLRAMYRNISNITVWEKTEHINVHRQVSTIISENTPITARAIE